jgi:4-hydroxybenzoate polyprenyltransferase and related prenyltransferases
MRRIAAVLASSHPVPAAGVTVIVVLLGVAVGLDPARLVVLGAVLALNQLSVGLSNDWLDAERDRVAGRDDKPVARGDLPVAVVRACAVVGAVAALALSPLLGIPFAVVHAIALAGGWAYNAWFKHGALSPLPYLVSFGLLPALATTALPEPAAPAWWAVAAGALLGLAAHVANVLPDLDDDAATGVRGLPHRLGARASTVLAGVALAGAAVCLGMGLAPGIPTVVGLAPSLGASVAAVVLGLRGSRWAFRLVILAALVDVVLLVLAGPGLAV